MYLITPTLYNSWKYFIKSEQSQEEFMNFLNKIKTPPTEAMQRGIDFEDAVREITETGLTNKPENQDELGCAIEIAEMVQGGLWQLSLSKKVGNYVLYGRADVIKGDTIHDIKRVSNYEVGKYQDSLQHLIYMECENLPKFQYDICDGKNVYIESYTKQSDNLEIILAKINEMISWIKANNNFNNAFETNWLSKY